MSSDGIFDFGFINFNNDNFGHYSSSAVDELFDAFNWENNTDPDPSTHQHTGPSTQSDGWYTCPSNPNGTSQSYTGIGVSGSVNDSTDLSEGKSHFLP